MKQWDSGLGKLIKTHPEYDSISSHEDANINSTPEAWLIATKLEFITRNFSIKLAFHRNSNQGDIIAPWRGFPTGGYTRTMTEVNWTSGTSAFLAALGCKLYQNLKLSLTYALNDRPGNENDSSIFYMGMRFDSSENLIFRWRLLIHQGQDNRKFTDTRLEVNYLF